MLMARDDDIRPRLDARPQETVPSVLQARRRLPLPTGLLRGLAHAESQTLSPVDGDGLNGSMEPTAEEYPADGAIPKVAVTLVSMTEDDGHAIEKEALGTGERGYHGNILKRRAEDEVVVSLEVKIWDVLLPVMLQEFINTKGVGWHH